MRITHVIHTFPPDSRAGSENYCEALALRQARRHTVSVFHRVAEPERPEYEVSEDQAGPLQVVRINRLFSDVEGFRDTYEAAPLARRFGEYLDRFQPAVVHFHHVTCLSTRCVHEAKTRGIAVVFTLHDFWLFCPRGQLLRRDLTLCNRHTDADCVRCMAYQLPVTGGHERVGRLYERGERLRRWRLPADVHRWLASRPFAGEAAALADVRERTEHVLEMCGRVDRFLAPTRFLRDRYVEFGVPREKIEVSDYGFDLEPWQRMPEAEPEPSGRLRVAYLGTWIPSKGVDVLIEAFRELDPRRAVLDLHGYAVPYDGVDDYEQSLRRLAAGAPHIRFGERYEPEDTPRLLAAADVLVVPSIWYENSPLTVHEAFLAGVPVVTSGHGGMRELVRQGGGLTFRPGDAGSLRRVLVRLIEDRDLLARLRRELPAVKGIEENHAEIEDLYHQLTGDAAGPVSAGGDAAAEMTAAQYQRWQLGCEAEKSFWLDLGEDQLQAQEQGYRALAEQIEHRLDSYGPERPDVRVLQIGCAVEDAVFYLRRGERYAIDPHADFYRREFARSRARGVDYRQAMGESIPFADGFFDVVICQNALDHVASYQTVLCEIRRVLRRPNLLFFGVDVYHQEVAEARWEKQAAGRVFDTLHPHTFTEETFEEALAAHGFEILERYPPQPSGKGDESYRYGLYARLA